MSIDQVALQLLRIAPLVSSTAGIMCAWGQHFAVYSFIDKTVPQEPAGATLPYWFPVLFYQLTWAVGIIHPLGGLLGVLNSFGPASDTLNSQARYLYFIGGLFAAGHLVYGKAAMRIISTIWNDRLPGAKNLRALSPWLRLNWWRIHTNNIPAFLFFLAALLSAVRLKE
ncbi:hypothetical protein BKA67DRAFT_661687 [Truncatella angustata]|uniref:Uncharacterized protein n=1 Tax=Truncatella angustata TaxID=152316 RepID=A0A9P8UF25_9PEZI|nr:uncharacterized protein BKA67DRAFT_661687 [Truncatella angustata]KAH6648732.1 hypothetical protein BKA67DRAFT_661687 [Truncatella angustata]